MKQRLLQTFVLLFCALSSAIGQNAIIGSGFSTGWTNPTNITYPFSASAGSSRIATFPSNGSGNRFWRMIRGWSGTGCLDGNNTEYGPPGNTDTPITTFGNVQPHGYTNGNGAWSVNDNATGHNFIFKTENPCNSNRWTMFRVQGAVSTFTSQSVTAGAVYPGQSLTFNVTLNAAAPTGQGVYLRYSTDNFATSTVVSMPLSSGSTYTRSVTGVTAGATYTYYYFTSGSGLTIAPADADFYTINLLNNGGSNYAKTIETAFVTSGLSTDWHSGTAWMGGTVPGFNQPVNINHNVSISSSVNVGNTSVNAGTVTIAQPVSVSIAAGCKLIFNGGNLTAAQGSVNANAAGAGLEINSGTLNISGTTGIFINTGNFVINGGSLTLGSNQVQLATGAAFISNGGTLTAPTAALIFAGSGSISGTVPITVNTINITAGTLTITTPPTVINAMNISGGNLDPAARIIYGASSVLRYYTSYTPFREWLSTTAGPAGIDRPGRVEIESGATLTLPNEARAMASGMTICSTCSLVYQANSNLITAGNWNNNHTGSNISYAANTARTTFTNSGSILIQKAGTTAEIFSSVTFLNTGIIQLNSDVNVTSTASDALVFNSSTGSISLNGKVLSATGAGAGITSSAAFTINGNSNAASIFSIGGNKTITLNSAINIATGATVRVVSGSLAVGGTSGFSFASGTTLLLNGGSYAQNAGSLSMAGTIQFNGGVYTGSVAPTYTSSSLLLYSANTTLGGEMTQTSGGAAALGRPQDVNITNGATLTLGTNDRAMAGSLTICATCSLTFTNLSGLVVGQNWTNNNPGANITYASDNNLVTFSNNNAATLSKVSGTEVFRGIVLSKTSTGSLQLNASIELTATSGIALSINSSAFNLNGNTCNVTGSGSAIVLAGGSVGGGAGSTLSWAGTRNFTFNSTSQIISGSVLLHITGGATTITSGSPTSSLDFASTTTLRLTGNLANSSVAVLQIRGTLDMAGGNYTGSTAPTYFNTSTLLYSVNQSISTARTEWNQANDGAVGVGRPQNVIFNGVVTYTNVSARSCAGTIAIGASGGVTGVPSPNYTTLGLRGSYTDNNTSATSITRVGLYFNTTTATTLTKSGSSALVLARFVQIGSGAITLNNNLDMIHPSATTVELIFGSGGLNIGNKTLTAPSGLFISMGSTGVLSSSGGTVNIGAPVSPGGTVHRYSNVAVNVNGGTYVTPSGGINVSGTAVFSLNNNSRLQLDGAYVGNSPVYSSTASLTYNAALTMGNEWTATTAGSAGTGRPHNININFNITSTATTRALAGLLTIGSTGSLTLGANPTLIMGVGLTDNNSTAQGFPTDVALVFANNSSTGSLSRGASPSPTVRSIETAGGSFFVTLNPAVTVTGDIVFTSGFGLTLVNNLMLTGTGQIRATGGLARFIIGSGQNITINGSYTIPATNTVDVDFSNTGGLIVPSSRSLTISGGALFNNTGMVSVAGTMTVNHASVTYPTNFTVSGRFNLNYNGGAAPTANWGTTGNLVIQGVTTTVPTNLNQNLANFTWQSAGQSQDVELGANSPTAISQTFEVSNTNGNRLFMNQSRTYTGSLVINGGRLAVSNTSTTITLAVGNLQINNSTNNYAQLLIGQGTGTANFLANAIEVNLAAASLPVALNERVIDYANTGSHQIAFTSFTQTGTNPGLLGNASNTSTYAAFILIGGGTGVISLAKPAFIDRVFTFTTFAPAVIAKPLEGTFNFNANAAVTFSPGAYLAQSGYVDFAVCNITHSNPDGITTGSTGLIRNTSGYRTYASGGSLTYNGSTSGVLGNALSSMSLAALTINNTAGVSTSGDFTVPASLTLNGNLNLGNHSLIVNSSSGFTLGTGRIVLNGSGDLNFDGTGTATLPNGLFSGNNTLGSITVEGGITGTLNNQNLTVTSGVNLVNGKLAVPVGSTLTLGTSASWPAETNSNHITGTTIMLPRTVGTGALNFMGVNLAAGTDNLGNLTITRTSGAAGRVTYASRSGIDCNWIIEADNQPVSGRSLTVSWPSVWDNGKNMNGIRFWRRFTSSDPWLPLGTAQNVSASNPRTLTFTTDHFSEWTSTDDNNTLPVTFVSVHAQRQGNTPVVHVTYNTAEERNVATYTLERSVDAKTWESVNTQQARFGTSNKYQIVDLNSSTEQTWYYRIKSTDLDGTTGYSPVVVVRPNSAQEPELALYPNPVKDVLLLNVSGTEEGSIHLTITNAEGRAVLTRNLDVLSGTNQLRLQDAELSALPAGVYMVQLALPNGAVLNKKMVK